MDPTPMESASSITNAPIISSVSVPPFPLPSSNIQGNVLEMLQIPKFYHANLITERAANILRIEKLTKEVDDNMKRIQDQNVAALNKDVDMKLLRTQYLAQLQEIADLKAHVITLEGKIAKLHGNNEKLRGDVSTLMLDKEFSTYLIPMQDLNLCFELEKNNKSLAKKLKRMRNSRVDSGHYIIANDELLNQKADQVKRRLLLMTPQCSQKFVDEFGSTFVTDFINIIPNLDPVPDADEDERFECEQWWK